MRSTSSPHFMQL
ncbi:uncharacterized, partial [Tachysurus ichikawai]